MDDLIRAVLPWLVGMVALGLLYLIVGNSPWLLLCVVPQMLTFVVLL